MNPDTHNLSRRRGRDRPANPPPRDISRWAIPFGVLASCALWVAAVVLLATDRDPSISTLELALLSATSVASLATFLYVRHYLLYRALEQHHRVIRHDVAELRAVVMEMRGRMTVAAGETRTLLEQISAKQTQVGQLYWQHLAEGLNDEDGPGGAIPFRRRP